ncbi:hypothetical protein CPC08DRAFT_643221, partial [Agrocybe pediades]
HLYWYAHILGIYHIFVRHPSHQEPLTIDFVHVQWYDLHKTSCQQHRWKKQRLFQIGFIPHVVDKELGISCAFGFLDPAHIIRGAHIEQGFAYGSTDELLPPSEVGRAASDLEKDEDWSVYYVNCFVDRDMVMH